MIIIEGEKQIATYRMYVLRAALKLEIKGMKRRGRSAASIIKKEFGFTGNRERLLEQLNQKIKELEEEACRPT